MPLYRVFYWDDEDKERTSFHSVYPTESFIRSLSRWHLSDDDILLDDSKHNAHDKESWDNIASYESEIVRNLSL